MPQIAPTITLTRRVRAVLERMARATTIEFRLAERVRIVLRSANDERCVDQARALGVDAQRVRRWRRRFAGAAELFAGAEAQEATDDELEGLITEVLGDEYRCGVPPKFTPDQIAQVIALACEEPEKFGIPVTHWTARDLARAAKEQGIVDDISPRHVGRFFRGGRDQASPVKVLAQPKDR